MDNSQVDQLNEPKLEVSRNSDDFWKPLFSHSFAVQFKCPACGKDFDMDGWFYKFETVTCVGCNAKIHGLFGIVLPASSTPNGQLVVETFEGEQGVINIPQGSYNLGAIINHIVLTLFLEKDKREPDAFGLADYYYAKPKFQYFRQAPATEIKQQKQKSIFSTLFS